MRGLRGTRLMCHIHLQAPPDLLMLLSPEVLAMVPGLGASGPGLRLWPRITVESSSTSDAIADPAFLKSTSVRIL